MATKPTTQKKPVWLYENWISEQAEKLSSEINRYALMGIFEGDIYILPANGATQGELIFGLKQPEQGRALDVLYFRHGSRASSIPRSQFSRELWEACRRIPICPYWG